MSRSFERRLTALEVTRSKPGEVAFITYAEDEQTEAQAVAAWETENGPLSECSTVFITIYEAA